MVFKKIARILSHMLGHDRFKYNRKYDTTHQNAISVSMNHADASDKDPDENIFGLFSSSIVLGASVTVLVCSPLMFGWAIAGTVISGMITCSILYSSIDLLST